MKQPTGPQRRSDRANRVVNFGEVPSRIPFITALIRLNVRHPDLIKAFDVSPDSTDSHSTIERLACEVRALAASHGGYIYTRVAQVEAWQRVGEDFRKRWPQLKVGVRFQSLKGLGRGRLVLRVQPNSRDLSRLNQLESRIERERRWPTPSGNVVPYQGEQVIETIPSGEEMSADALAAFQAILTASRVLGWELLPAGHFDSLRRSFERGDRPWFDWLSPDVDISRILYIHELNPRYWFRGAELGNRQYLVAEFEGVAIADSPEYANALYYLYFHEREEWQRAFRHSKELAREAGARRLYHTDYWKRRLKRVIRSGKSKLHY